MDYLYQLPERDKEEEGFTKSSNYALTKFLKLDLTKVPKEKVDEFITDAWWEYIEKEDLDNEKASDLLGEICKSTGGHIPYGPNYAEHYADLIEGTSLERVEIIVHVLADHDKLLSDPMDIRYLWQILQERVNKLTLDNTPEGLLIKIPRLNAAIFWLKGYEERLANSLAKENTSIASIPWKGSKTDLAELGYALLEAGVIEANNRASAVKKLGEIFGVSLGDNPAIHLQTIQKRKAGAVLTPLLDHLREAFSNYLLQKEDDSIINKRKHPSRR